MYQYRNGVIAPSGYSVRARTVEDAVRAVGQTFAAVGSQDPRLNSHGKIDFRLQRQISRYKKQDPLPNRVKPIPAPILRQVLAVALMGTSYANIAVADMIALAFFFLLRPGEYTGSKSESEPFRLADAQLIHGPIRLNLGTASETALLSAMFTSLTFTTQESGVRGEVIGLSHSGSPQFSPTICLSRWIIHLRRYQAPPETPLASVYNAQQSNPSIPAISQMFCESPALLWVHNLDSVR
jgi:hypothetical protein